MNHWTAFIMYNEFIDIFISNHMSLIRRIKRDSASVFKPFKWKNITSSQLNNDNTLSSLFFAPLVNKYGLFIQVSHKLSQGIFPCEVVTFTNAYCTYKIILYYIPESSPSMGSSRDSSPESRLQGIFK